MYVSKKVYSPTRSNGIRIDNVKKIYSPTRNNGIRIDVVKVNSEADNILRYVPKELCENVVSIDFNKQDKPTFINLNEEIMGKHDKNVTIRCPKCDGDSISAHTLVIGYSTVDVNTWTVEDGVDDAEPYGDLTDIDEFTCFDCGFHFDNEGEEIKYWWEK